MAKFKEVFNEIGEKYKDIEIDEIYKDYNLLCLLEHISDEFIDEDIKDEIMNIILDLKTKLENQEVRS